ncbi:class I SAM-dependent methyltransferase [Azospirillum sp. RWY-5-1]|uniref:Class I SAM-dependent methyltransferase n=1 Tax=Azospirillum oleiclasticum TaxID=2735135 RepID=A0ABX2T5F3_9PROT|nr:class I SAM-dependent methyltransferase [Azospirillum oleiclasticum]NYZ19511.1 class I SAM-dependent methyltransferase [Azospirillum oleiclasticum]
MSGFDPGWLALREPADHAARAPSLFAETVAAAGDRPTVVDLGCGTGSNLRALAPRLPPAQRWRLVDHDPALLALAAAGAPEGTERIAADLRDIDALPLDGATLVTAAALFDLVSAAWFDRFAKRLAAARLPLYAVLTYDGNTTWTPAHPLDPVMIRALNDHQRTDKGFGPALGPDATVHMRQSLESYGCEVRTADSPWTLTGADAALVMATSAGYARSAVELGAVSVAEAEAWLAFRRATAVSGEMLVGHTDLLVFPGHCC